MIVGEVPSPDDDHRLDNVLDLGIRSVAFQFVHEVVRDSGVFVGVEVAGISFAGVFTFSSSYDAWVIPQFNVIITCR